jgi:D-glycero-alpha-D-manno-heptose 1-phosphate guanylyltransferase
MVDIDGQPFLAYLLTYLGTQGIRKVVLAVSHKWESIHRYFGASYEGMAVCYSVEEERLGTGGGVRQALSWTELEDIFVVNGDTYFEVPFEEVLQHHRSMHRDITLALKPMRDFSRYGAVTLIDGKVTQFEEKQHREEGYINGGVMALNRHVFDQFQLAASFSLERDLLMTHLPQLDIGGFVSEAYFIDVGLPEDLDRARRELPDILSVADGSPG